MGRITTRARIQKVTAHTVNPKIDAVVVEEPLEIRVNDTPIAVTMRTPGNDIELAQGFLQTEGLIADRDDIATIRYCNSSDDTGRNTYNVLNVDLAPGICLPEVGIQRNFYTTSSCGVCGKASLDAIRQRTIYPPADDHVTITADTITALPDRMRTQQRVFATTGGLHAAALFDSTGQILALREDIGRHNAVDKLIGWALEDNRLPLRATTLAVSGRASFELTQKAVMAGIPIMAAVSAASSLAVDLAQDAGLTLIGFLRGDTMNIYTHPERVMTTD